MIDTIYKVLQTVINKENDGYVSPTEYNLLAKQVQEKIFRGYFEDNNRDQNRANKGLTNRGYSNLPLNQRQRIDIFSSNDTITISSDEVTLPTDIYFIEDMGVTLDNGRVVEENQKNISGYASLSLAAPSTTYPVYESNGTKLTIKPAGITGDVTIRYIRKPLDPKWTYNPTTELYNPSATDHQDFELHSSEFSNIVIEMLSYFGINIREEKVVQIAEQFKNILNVKDNA